MENRSVEQQIFDPPEGFPEPATTFDSGKPASRPAAREADGGTTIPRCGSNRNTQESCSSAPD